LAIEYHDKAIAIILSGNGWDDFNEPTEIKLQRGQARKRLLMNYYLY